MIKITIKTIVLIVLFPLYAQFFLSEVLAANSLSVDLGNIVIAPAVVPPGEYPNIEARLSQAPKGAGKNIVVNIIAVVTQPDKRIKTWNWKKITISRDAAKTVTVPKEFDTSAVGTYRVEILVYSNDMKQRLARQFHTFDVAERLSTDKKGNKVPFGAKEVAASDTAKQEQKKSSVGLGLYGNVLNPAAGATVIVWPSRSVGVQGLFSTGEFTSYEGRLIVKADWSSKYAIYGGVGYIHVMTEKDVIGVATQFEDGGISGVLGVEVNLGKKTLLYIEASSAKIDLAETVTNGVQTANASVKYAPVTIGIGLVMMLF